MRTSLCEPRLRPAVIEPLSSEDGRPGDSGRLRAERLPWVARHAAVLSRTSAYLASALVVAPFLYHLAHGSKAYLGLFEDDYFYYAIVADRLVMLGKLSFDGSTTTNGFHPLWFTVVVLLRVLFGRFGTAFYLALTVVSAVSMLVTYELARRFAQELGASPRLAPAVAAVYALGTGQLFTSGMECVVAVPLLLWLLVLTASRAPVTPRRAAAIGFVASLAVLARLDISVAVALIVAGYIVLVRPPFRVLWANLLAFSVGGLLVPAYAVANLAWFGSPLPVSALAKSLQTSPSLNVTYAQRVALGTVYGPSVAFVLPLGLVALWLLVRRDPYRLPAARFAGGLALVFAFVFFGLNALKDWVFFGWYAYPIAVASISAMVFIGERWASLVGPRVQTVVAAVLVALAPAAALRYYAWHGPGWTVADNTLLAMSHELGEHMRGRDGRFAMGAIAGFSAYALLDKPMLQLEGIISDPRLIEHLRRQSPIETVLSDYNIDYLIVSLASVRAQRRDGCYLVTQPNAEWAGRRTAKLSGEICAEPIVHFVTQQGANPWSRFSALETLVWDLRGARWQRPRAENPS